MTDEELIGELKKLTERVNESYLQQFVKAVICVVIGAIASPNSDDINELFELIANFASKRIKELKMENKRQDLN